MPRHLKRGMDASAIKAADAKVRETVESILAEIETGKDAAVRALSQKFDNWSPPSFKLAPAEIDRKIAAVLEKIDLDNNIVRIVLQDGVASGVLVAHLYDLGPSRGYRLAGLDRPEP